jgi:hypothetical protein
MNLLTLPFKLPLLPVQGFIRLAEMIQEQAEQELYNPAAVRRQLEDVEQAQASGEISDQEAAEAEDEAVGRLVQPTPTRSPRRRTGDGS